MKIEKHSQSELVWVTKTDPMPDTCCDCGMFTYDRVTVKHVDQITTAKSEAGCASILLTLVIHLFLGPLGWLIAAVMEGNDSSDTTKTVKKKSKIKLPQCNVCRGVRRPEVVESQVTHFSFEVHPKFAQRFEELKQLSREEDE